MDFRDAVMEMLKGKVVTCKSNGYPKQVWAKIENGALKVTDSISHFICDMPGGSFLADKLNKQWEVYNPSVFFKDLKVGEKFTKNGVLLEKIKVEGTIQYFAKTSDGKVYSIEYNEVVVKM